MTDEELSEKLATEVMGWTRELMCDRWYWITRFPTDPETGASFTCHAQCFDWQPLERINQAWLVVEKMRDWCFTLTRERHYAAEPVDGYYAVVGASGRWAESASRAICLAALAAKGVEVPGD